MINEESTTHKRFLFFMNKSAGGGVPGKKKKKKEKPMPHFYISNDFALRGVPSSVRSQPIDTITIWVRQKTIEFISPLLLAVGSSFQHTYTKQTRARTHTQYTMRRKRVRK